MFYFLLIGFLVIVFNNGFFDLFIECLYLYFVMGNFFMLFKLNFNWFVLFLIWLLVGIVGCVIFFGDILMVLLLDICLGVVLVVISNIVMLVVVIIEFIFFIGNMSYKLLNFKFLFVDKGENFLLMVNDFEFIKKKFGDFSMSFVVFIGLWNCWILFIGNMILVVLMFFIVSIIKLYEK